MAKDEMTETRERTPEERIRQPAATEPKRSNKALIIMIVGAGVLVFALIGMVGAAMFATLANNQQRMHHTTTIERGNSDWRGGGMPHERYYEDEPRMRGMSGVGMMVGGVVTSVSGDTFVVSGNGTQTTVEKNSQTAIVGTSETVKVNDSVTVMGTKDGGTFTATTIHIHNLGTN